MSNATRTTNNSNDNNYKTKKITIIGAGWAGLTCAYELLKAGYSDINIIEAAPQAGGRARGVALGDINIDNGQHLLIRGYENTLKILEEVNPRYQESFTETPFEIFAKNPSEKFHFKLINYRYLPHLLNLLLSVLLTKSFSFKDKIRLLKFSALILQKKFKLKEDITVESLFKKYNFSKDIINKFLNPIVVSTMTTQIQTASSRVFLNILRLTFFTKRNNSNLLFAKKDLTSLFVKPLIDKMIQLGGKIEYNNLINKISVNEETNSLNQIYIHSNKHQEPLITDILVLATPPWQTRRIIDDIPKLADLKRQLEQFTYEPITSIYIEFEKEFNLETPMVGIMDSYSHWTFNHSAGNKNIACIVISSQNHQMLIDHANKEEIIQQAIEEVKKNYDLPNIIKIKYIQEKRAAFSCNVLVNNLRPSKKTNILSIFLAGDYTTTGYPSTLEGAILSGKLTSDTIIKTI